MKNGASHPLTLDYQSAHIGKSWICLADCLEWLSRVPENSIHAIVTDPPYGVKEYDLDQLAKRAAGQGGIWRIPPSFDGHTRAPLPRFTALDAKDAPTGAAVTGMRGKWLIVMRDGGACEATCLKKLYTMRQARLLVGKELDRVARVMLIDDDVAPSPQMLADYAGTAFVSAKTSTWLTKLPRKADDATNGHGYIYAVDPMGNLFMRYQADGDIKELAADLRRVLKASQLGKDMESESGK